MVTKLIFNDIFNYFLSSQFNRAPDIEIIGRIQFRLIIHSFIHSKKTKPHFLMAYCGMKSHEQKNLSRKFFKDVTTSKKIDIKSFAFNKKKQSEFY